MPVYKKMKLAGVFVLVMGGVGLRAAEQFPYKGMNPEDINLIEAVKDSDKNKIEEALENNANINTQDNNGDTPIIIAVRKGRKSITKMLFEKGADPLITNKLGETALTIEGEAQELLKNLINKAFKKAKEEFGAATHTFLKTPNKKNTRDSLLKALGTLASKAGTYFTILDYDAAKELMYRYDRRLNDLKIKTLSKALDQEQIINRTALELKAAILDAIKNEWATDPIIEESKKRLNDALKPQQQEPEKQKTESKKKLKKEQKELPELTDANDILEIKSLSGEEASQELKESYYKTAYNAVYDVKIDELKQIYADLPNEYKKEPDKIFTDLKNRQPLLFTAITTITALHGLSLKTKEHKEVATEIYIKAEAMAIIKYLVETVGVRTTGLPIGDGKVDVITLAIQQQYKPMVEYFIDHDGVKAKQIPGIFKYLLTYLAPIYCYYEDTIETLKFDDVRELVTQIGYYPCLSLIIDNLIKNNVDLATIKIKLGSSEKGLPLIEYILCQLASHNLTSDAYLDELPAKGFYELILKLYNLMDKNKVQFKAPKNANELLNQGLEGLKIFINEKKFAIDKNGNPINPITDLTALNSKIEAALNKAKEIEEKPVVKKTSQEEKLYNAIADGDGKKIKKLLENKIKFAQTERYLKFYDCECPIVPWLLYYLNKYGAEKTFPSDKLSEIILERNKKLEDQNPKDLVKKHKKEFFKKLKKGFNIVKKYADNDLEIGDLEEITHYPD